MSNDRRTIMEAQPRIHFVISRKELEKIIFDYVANQCGVQIVSNDAHDVTFLNHSGDQIDVKGYINVNSLPR
jgi:hypothetical protein